MSLVVDFGRALSQMGDPRFRTVLWRALLVVALAFAGTVWAATFALGRLLPDTVTLPWIGAVGFVDAAASWAVIGLVLALSVVLMAPAAAAAASFFLDDVAAAVEARHYPALPPARPPGLARQARDAAAFLGLALAANALALVVYVAVPPLAPFVFWAVNGYLLGREYFELVAVRRLDAAAARRLRRRHGGRLWLAGVALAVPLSVPVLNLFMPILGVAVFTHQFQRLVGRAATV